jgi:pimeloyl-ACP methyl ester carboxylesterase
MAANIARVRLLLALVVLLVAAAPAAAAKPPLVMVPGYGVAVDDWDPALLRALAKERKLVLIDNQGDSIHAMAEHVVAVVEARGLRRAAIFGYSMGGGVVSDLLAHHPRLATKAVLAAPLAPAPAGVLAEGEVLQRIAPPRGPMHPSNWDLMFERRADFERYRARLAPGYEAMGQEQMTDQYGAAGVFQTQDTGVWDLLPAVQVPTLVAITSADQLAPPANGRALADRLARAKLVRYESGHAFLFEPRHGFAKRVLQFLR